MRLAPSVPLIQEFAARLNPIPPVCRPASAHCLLGLRFRDYHQTMIISRSDSYLAQSCLCKGEFRKDIPLASERRACAVPIVPTTTISLSATPSVPIMGETKAGAFEPYGQCGVMNCGRTSTLAYPISAKILARTSASSSADAIPLRVAFRTRQSRLLI